MADLCCDKLAGEKIVSAARGWIGTPYLHQASSRQVGTDCLGLLRGVWRETIGIEREIPEAYSPDWSEAPGSEPMIEGLERHLLRVEIEDSSRGDVLVFRMLQRGAAKHLAILCSDGIAASDASMIHAYSGLSVVETRISTPWLRRLVAVFRLPLIGTLSGKE